MSPAAAGPTRRVLAESRAGVLHVRLEDPDHNNALGPDLVAELRAALSTGDATRAVLLTGAGRNFCAGGDHTELAALGPDAFRRYLADVAGLFATVEALPLVVGVQRAVVGGGLELALLADFVLAADDAWFQLPQIELGGRVGTPTLRHLVARCGLSAARRLLLAGERFDAATALATGLGDRVVARAKLPSAAEDLANTLAGRPPAALARARESLSDLIGAADGLRTAVERRERALHGPDDARSAQR